VCLNIEIFTNKILRKGLSETKSFRFCENIMPNPDYRKMFECLAEYKPDPEDLKKLATVMSKKTEFIDVNNLLEGSSKIEKEISSKIPAGYTYLAQFIAHDISFDSRSDRFLEEDYPWNDIDVSKVKNKRAPLFDLETIYGYVKPINEGETPRHELMQNHELPLLKLGDTGGFDPPGTPGISYPNDLSRKNESVMANIVDPRNDENLLLAQTQVAFTKFHNAIVLRLSESGRYKTKEDLFDKARKVTIRYYQHIIFEDFLLKFIEEPFRDQVVNKVKSGNSYYSATFDDKFIPLEFSVAAFRMGHSMIREEYNLNIKNNPARLRSLMLFTGKGMTESKLPTLPSVWIINWYSFYNIDNSFNTVGSNPNFAETLDTGLPIALLRLRPKLPNTFGGIASSIAAFDLFRGRAFGLPTGQAIASAIGANPISSKDMGDLLINKKIDGEILNPDEARKVKERLRTAFSEETPLWFYILAEAELQGDGKLGVVGSTILAETIIKILYLSEFSILRENWETDEDFLLKEYPTFGMAEMLKFVRDTNTKYFKMLYPGRKDYFDELNPLAKG
jgi:hypothetical protein